MLTFKFVCFISTFLNIQDIPVSGFINRNIYSAEIDKVHDLIKYNVEAHYKLKTLRIFLENSTDIQNIYPQWDILYQVAPILLIPTKLSEPYRLHFYTSTVLYFLFDVESRNFVINHLLSETANRRWDRLVLIGMDKYFRDDEILKLLNGYRLKMCLSIESNTIWVEPSQFDKDNFLIPISDLSDYTTAPSMGSNIHARHFRIAGCEFPPWTLKIREADGRQRVWGTHYEIIAFAAKIFNFTFETNVLDGPNYGEKHQNGTWSGMYAMVYYREQGYDWCFMLGHDASWSAYVDYASTFGTIDLVFAAAWPTRELKWTAVMEPLQVLVWAWTAASFFIVSIFIYIFKKVEAKKLAGTKIFKEFSLVESFMASFSTILEQGVDNFEGIKSILTIWLMFTIIIGTGYKSTLKSRLTFPSPEIIPSNYKELAETDDFKIILNAQGVVEKMFFATTTVPEMVKVRDRMRNEPSTENCVAAAFLNGRTACIGWFPYFKQTVSATLTLFSSMEPLIYTTQAAHFNSLSMAFQKDSIFVDALTPITAALYETGVYFTWEQNVNNYYKEIGRQKVLQDKTSQVYEQLVQLSKTGENMEKPLKMGNVWVVFVMSGIGWGCGVLILIMESIFGRSKIQPNE